MGRCPEIPVKDHLLITRVYGFGFIFQGSKFIIYTLKIATFLELLSNLVFEALGSCSNLACFGSFNTVFEFHASDNFGQIIKAA